MAQTNPYTNYRNARVSTINRGDMVVLVYDAAIKYLEEVKICMQKKDYNGKGMYMDRAFAAINELRTSLSFDYDRKIAESLSQLYFFMTKQMSNATLKNDIKSVDVVIDILKGLKEAWEQAAKNEKSQKPVTAPA